MNLAYAAVASGVMLLMYTLMTMRVGFLRGRHKIQAPATSGHPAFERAYRVQLNTLEHMAVALPSLWIYSAFGAPFWAAVAAAIWIVGRIVYAVCYVRAPETRFTGMVMTIIAEIWLLGGALWGGVRALGV